MIDAALVDIGCGKITHIYKNFVKVDEKMFVKMLDFLPWHPRPRCITCPGEVMKAIIGPLIYAIENFLAKVDPCYCNGLNWGDLSNHYNKYVKWIPNCCIMVGDGSSFDST